MSYEMGDWVCFCVNGKNHHGIGKVVTSTNDGKWWVKPRNVWGECEYSEDEMTLLTPEHSLFFAMESYFDFLLDGIKHTADDKWPRNDMIKRLDALEARILADRTEFLLTIKEHVRAE